MIYMYARYRNTVYICIYTHTRAKGYYSLTPNCTLILILMIIISNKIKNNAFICNAHV